MRHEITSLNTKKALAAALKNAMENKMLSKITISEIVTACGVNRKTFYYHFNDIYDLLKWLLQQEAIEVVRRFDPATDCEKAIRFIIDYVEDNRHILNCAYDSIGADVLKRFFFGDFIGIIRAVVDSTERELGLQVDADFKEFYCLCCTEALAGMLINWFQNEAGYDREKALSNTVIMLTRALPAVLQSAPKAKEE